MRIERPHRHERFGAVRIHETTQVVELDSGLDAPRDTDSADRLLDLVSARDINAIEHRMAIVVPTKNERRKVIEGVLSGIPHDCLIVLVSASEREPVDRYAIESELLERFCRSADRRAVAVHQDDPGVAEALSAAGMGQMVNEGRVRRGKGEAMLLGMLLAAAHDKEHVGFVDADNYVPGAVHEYVKVFAAGLHLAPTPYAMVRISWQSKPKIENGRLVFNKWGRTTHVTNRFLNEVLSVYNGSGTEVIRTGNAGEHAMTLELAKRMRFAGGFAVEPFELMDLFDQFGGARPSPHPDVVKSFVDVFQIETRNPHFHEDKGEEHVSGMKLESVLAVMASPVCPESVRNEIVEFLREEGTMVAETSEPIIYEPWEDADLDAFGDLLDKAQSHVDIHGE